MKYLITVLFAFATLNSFAQSKSTDEESTGFQKISYLLGEICLLDLVMGERL